MGSLVLAANAQDQFVAMLHGQLDEERRRNARLLEENERLKRELEQSQRELKAERQRMFCKDRPAKDKLDEPAASRKEAGRSCGTSGLVASAADPVGQNR